MRHFNFLSNLLSILRAHRVHTLALTVGSPSAHRRGTMLRLCSVVAILLTIGVGNVWGAKITYTFSSAAWAASPANWTGSKNGNQFNSSAIPLGVQVCEGQSGVTVTSPTSYTNITKVEVVYSSSSKATGSINIKIGTNSALGALSISKSQTRTTLTFTPASAQTGSVVMTCNVSKNSMGINSVTIYYETAVTLNKNSGTADGSVKFAHDATAYTTSTFTPVTRTDYTCTGYWTASSGGTKILNADGSFAASNITVSTTPYVSSSKWAYTGATLTLHAQWAAAVTTYTVTYNLNGGGGTTPTETNKAAAATFSLHNGTSNITAPAGKAFSKWKDQDDNLYNGGTTYTMPAKNVTLTAQWSCITPTISGQPAAATTYWDMDSPTALTVTASGGALSHQWQMSADGSSSWSNVGTNSSSYTPLIANGTKYYRCTATNTGSSCNTSVTSNNALVTIKTLSSIAVKTSPKTTYFAGETFSPTNLVITLTASDASTQDRSYTSYSSGFTFSPTTATALTTSDEEVTITYGGEDVDLDINVYSVTVNKVDDAGNPISADGVSATWTLGTKALSASYGSTQYRFKEWAFDGSNNGLSITSTGSANTTITGTPTGNVTIKAIFYAPRIVKWSVNGDDSYNTGAPTESVPYGTTWSALKLPSDPTFLCGDQFVGWTITNIGVTGLDKDDDADDITALDLMTSANKSGKTASKYQITGTSITFYGVVADYTTE